MTPDLERFLKTLTGNTDIEDSLDKLDKLTQEEARMASAELLKITHSIDGKVMGVDDRVKGVEEKVQDVCDDVQDVRGDVHNVGVTIEGRVQDVHGDVQDIDHRVQSIGDNISGRVQGVDHKLDQANRSLSLQHLLIISSAHTTFQETSSEMVFRDGYRPQIHPPTITTHAKLITMVQPNGFFKEVYSVNGNPRGHSCGSTENVRYSRPSRKVHS